VEIIPAVDIRDGKCVRLLRGDYDRETVFADDPVEMALRWETEGAPRLHIVDLDGAREGCLVNLDTIARITAAVKIPTELGGGIRTLDSTNQALDAGIGRVIIGTSAAANPDVAETIFRTLGEQAVAGVDARNGIVSIKGWRQDIGESVLQFVKRVEGLGARRIIFTDIAQDGTLEGVNIARVREVVEAANVPVIAAGGVTYIRDIVALKELEPSGLDGVIVGKALYAGTLKLKEALRVANQPTQ